MSINKFESPDINEEKNDSDGLNLFKVKEILANLEMAVDAFMTNAEDERLEKEVKAIGEQLAENISTLNLHVVQDRVEQISRKIDEIHEDLSPKMKDLKEYLVVLSTRLLKIKK